MLVQALMLNPILPAASLGRAAGLTAVAAGRRLRRLHRIGVLRGCRAVLRPDASVSRPGPEPEATEMFVAVSASSDPSIDGTVPQSVIHAVYHTTGRWSEVLRVGADENERNLVLHALSRTASTVFYEVARIRHTYVDVHSCPGACREGSDRDAS